MAIARRSANITVMVEAAEKAGRSLIRDFGEVENLQVSKKGPGDFVSTADLKAEKIVLSILQKARPKYNFLLEEGGKIKGEDKSFTWIVDPLDGTTNFLHGIPHWAVAIALEKDGEIIAGVTYDPIKDELFWAEKGMGAYVNNRRLRVTKRDDLHEALISTDDAIHQAPKEITGLRRFGSAALDLAYVAAGRFDGYWEHGLKPWDMAGGGLMVREAGGYATTTDGDKDFIYKKSVLAANPALHKVLLKSLAAPKTKSVKSAS